MCKLCLCCSRTKHFAPINTRRQPISRCHALDFFITSNNSDVGRSRESSMTRSRFDFRNANTICLSMPPVNIVFYIGATNSICMHSWNSHRKFSNCDPSKDVRRPVTRQATQVYEQPENKYKDKRTVSTIEQQLEPRVILTVSCEFTPTGYMLKWLFVTPPELPR
jgi:hypothetical protein